METIKQIEDRVDHKLEQLKESTKLDLQTIFEAKKEVVKETEEEVVAENGECETCGDGVCECGTDEVVESEVCAECGETPCECEEIDEELSAKQKKLDIDKDGDIGKDDLGKVRNGALKK